MSVRKVQLFNGGVFHIYSRSIAEYKIFNVHSDFVRMKNLLVYYMKKRPVSYSDFLALKPEMQKKVIEESVENYVDIIAYCIMPTHIHLILSQTTDNGISKFMEKVLKSYSMYYNKKTRREGPLWSGKFRNVLVETNEQLLHLTRYIHLNPVTIYLVEKPEEWEYSSYREYIGEIEGKKRICNFEKYLDIKIGSYRIFVEERKDYQRELQKIKHLMLE